MLDIVDVLATNGAFGALMKLLRHSGLDRVLRDAGPYTFFAPATTPLIVQPAQDVRLFLLNHIVSGRYTAADLMQVATLPALSGLSLTVDASHGLRVGASYLIQADLEAANGVIHMIERPVATS